MKKLLILLAAGATLTCGALCLTACSGGTEYSVTCGACENGYVIVSDTSVEAGEKVILAAHPAAGYKLTSFFLDGEELDGVSFVMPEKDVTVSAQFEAVTYSITYVLDGATVSGNNPLSYTVESAAELIAPEKEGYEVCEWYRYPPKPAYEYEYDYDYYLDIESYKVTSLEGLYGNLTLYAKCYNVPHEITCTESGDGYCRVEGYYGQAFYGETFTVEVEPYHGYELDYITVNGERIEGASFTMPHADVEVAAKFKPVIYKISYELDGGENAQTNPDFYTVEDDYITFADATKEGYTFIWWYYIDEDGDKQFLYNSTYPVYSLGDITIYAYFEEDTGEE